MRAPSARRPLLRSRTRGGPRRRSALVGGALALGLAVAGVAAPSASARATLSAVHDPVELGSFNPERNPVGTLTLRNTDSGGSERVNIAVVPQDPLTTSCGTNSSAQINANDTKDCLISVTGGASLPEGSFSRKATITAVLAAVGEPAGDPRGSIDVTIRGTVDRTPPAVPAFDPAVPATTSSRTPTFSWSSSGASSYGCRLDGADVPCTTNYTASGLTAGNHTFAVRALDSAGNPSAFQTAPFRVLPLGPGVPVLGASTVDFGLRRTTGGAQDVSLFNDGGANLAVGTPTVGAPFSVSDDCPASLPPGDSCTATFSYAGPPSGKKTASVDLAPGVAGGAVALSVDGRSAVVAPDTGAVSSPSETSRTFAFTATEADAKRLECSLDSPTVFATCTSPVTRTGLADGDHVFRVRQVTVDNVTSAAASVPFRVARIPVVDDAPVLTPDDPSRRPGSRFAVAGGTFTGTDPITTALSWERCKDATCTPIAGPTGGTYEATDDDVGFGLRAVRTATNEAGDTRSPTATTSLIRATLEAPDVRSPEAGDTNATQRFTWDGTETDIARFECSDADAPFATCASPTTLTGLPDGDRTFRVRQVAADGVVSPAQTVAYRVAFPVRVTAGPAITAENPTRTAGSRFSVTPGAYDGTAPITITEQWERCSAAGCVPVTGATGSTYTTSADDVGATLRVVETASNELGPRSTTSAPTDPILAAPVLLPPPGGTTGSAPAPGALPLGKISATGHGARLTLTTTIPGAGTIEAVATHTRPSSRARPRAKSVLVPGRGRFVYARQSSTKVKAKGRVVLRLVRTAAGRRAHFASKTLALRVVVHFTRDGGRTARSVRTVRVRIRR